MPTATFNPKVDAYFATVRPFALPIVIFYLTAIVEDGGEVHFFDDIYNYDTEMQKVFSKGPPYPVKPEPIVPKTKEGDTV